MLPTLTPPIFDGVDREVGRVAGERHADVSFVALGIVDAVRSGPTFGVLEEVVIVDLLRLLTPGLAGILELADEFLLLGVDADARVARAAKIVTLLVNVAELPIAFGVGLVRGRGVRRGRVGSFRDAVR
jgi:hypothetical protein